MNTRNIGIYSTPLVEIPNKIFGIATTDSQWVEFKEVHSLPDKVDRFHSAFLNQSALLCSKNRRLLMVLSVTDATADLRERLMNIPWLKTNHAIPFATLIGGDILVISINNGMIFLLDREGGWNEYTQIIPTKLSFDEFATRFQSDPENLITHLDEGVDLNES